MVTAQVVMSLLALMPMLAVVADGGLLLVERRHAQATADAAALAAASDLYANWNTNHGTDPSGTALASAMGVASANGYTNDGTTSTVTVNIPPKAGNFIKQAGYAEVIVTWNQQRVFSGIGGTIPISARAVARGLMGGAGVYLLSSSGTALDANGALDVKGGSVVVNSTDSSAVSTSGSLTASAFYIAGNYSGDLTTTPIPNNIQTGASAMGNPLAYIPTPSIPSAAPNPTPSGSVMTYYPGLYPSGLPISSNAVLSSGLYYVQGDFSASGTLNSAAGGVMIYLDGTGLLSLTGTGAVTLSPMTTGTYAGITLFQNPTSTNGITLNGNGHMNITGTIYAPSAPISMTGSGDTFGSQIIASTMSMVGNGTVTMNAGPGGVRLFGLVE